MKRAIPLLGLLACLYAGAQSPAQDVPSAAVAAAAPQRPAMPGQPSAPQEPCASAGFFARPICLQRECQRAEMAAHPVCVDLRSHQQAREAEALRRQLYTQ